MLIAVIATIISLLLHISWWLAFGFGMLGVVLSALKRGGRGGTSGDV